MTDLEYILPLWRELEAAQAEYVLATIVAVEGSSYRKPWARMLLAQDGRRAGTVSGGCLEAEVAKRAFWLSANGPVIERYSTLEDDGDLPYGSGCGGVVYILLERKATASPLLARLELAFTAREPMAIATVLDGPNLGRRAVALDSASQHPDAPTDEPVWMMDLQLLAASALHQQYSFERAVVVDDRSTRVWIDYVPARPGLWIFGAGDDAKPLVHLARELGWFVALADGRAHLAIPSRFPKAHEVHVLPIQELPKRSPQGYDVHATDAAVLVTHSFEQDSRILAMLLSRDTPPQYIGVLGPQRRTREALAGAARLLNLEPDPGWVESWLERMNAPTGLDLGADTPATIALSIISEIQKTLTRATAQPLREVRATNPFHLCKSSRP